MPSFASAFGAIKLAQKSIKPHNLLVPVKAPVKEQPKPAAKPKETKPKNDDEDFKEEKKEKNPLDALPESPWV